MGAGVKSMKRPDEIRAYVRAEYGQAARQARDGMPSCCGTGDNRGLLHLMAAGLYQPDQTAGLPAEAVRASFGCGNPTALATMNSGETVLDLGSGGGLDVLLSAQRVGPAGKAYGLDMTDEMLDLARENQRKAGVTNAEFLKGDLEQIPMPDESMDIVISNCVINLSPDKDRVLAEALRVLKPGGRLAVSDIVIRGTMPREIRHSVELWAGCVAGALEETVYVTKLRFAGFEQISLEPTRIYTAEDAREFLMGAGLNVEALSKFVAGKFVSAFIRAVKPPRVPARGGPSSCA